MLEQKLLKKIEVLSLNQDITKTLENNNIIIIKDLWEKTRTNLKNINLNDAQINQIIIKLQLFGIDLNKKVYKNK